MKLYVVVGTVTLYKLMSLWPAFKVHCIRERELQVSMNFSQENGQVFFASQPYPRVCTAQGESKKKCRRRKRNKEGGDFRKRKLNDDQVRKLEENFNIDHNLETKRKQRIAAELGMDPQQVAVWFQNRRVRYRVKQLEMEYSKLQAEHQRVTIEKSHLETEVLQLRAELSNADNEMKRLVEGQTETSSCSQESSSFSSEIDPNLVIEFGYEGYGHLFQVYDDDYFSGLE